MNLQGITIDKGIIGNATYTFSNGSQNHTIQIIKTEGATTTPYKVSVALKGLEKNRRPKWEVKINDQFPKYETKDMSYAGTTKLVFESDVTDVVKVTETDEKSTSSLWVELRNYVVSENRPVVSDKVQALLEKARVFKPTGDEKVKKIFWVNSGEVLIYAQGKQASIYSTKTDGEFAKCEAVMNYASYWSESRCNAVVKLPGEEMEHEFTFGLGRGQDSSVLWDKKPMKTIQMP